MDISALLTTTSMSVYTLAIGIMRLASSQDKFRYLMAEPEQQQVTRHFSTRWVSESVAAKRSLSSRPWTLSPVSCTHGAVDMDSLWQNVAAWQITVGEASSTVIHLLMCQPVNSTSFTIPSLVYVRLNDGRVRTPSRADPPMHKNCFECICATIEGDREPAESTLTKGFVADTMNSLTHQRNKRLTRIVTRTTMTT